MLIKLLEINIVAKSFCGFCNNSTTDFCLLEFDSEAFVKFALDNEKKATSAPEISAESISNNISTAKLTISHTLKLSDILMNKNVGSGSHYFQFN